MASARLTLRQLRSDRVLIWCWLPLGSFAIYLVIQAWERFAGPPPTTLYTLLDVVWIAVTFTLIARRSTSRCPRCDHRLLRGFPWLSLKKVECAVCGYEIPES